MKFRNSTKLTAILLIMSALLAACGNDAPVYTDTASSTESETEAPKNELTLSLPDKRFDGYTVRYLTHEDACRRYYINIHEENGDALSDAAYKRDMAVSDLFGVKFDAFEVDPGFLAQSLQTDVFAGDHSYDFVILHPTVGPADCITSGILYDWNELEYVDFDRPYWNSLAKDNLSIGGKSMLAVGDLTMTNQGMVSYIFNKNYLEDYKIKTDLYELVYDGKWTLDALAEVTKDIAADLNGDAEMDGADQYGFLMGPVTTLYIFGAGQRLTKLDDDGCPVLDMGGERMANIVEKVYNLINVPDTRLTPVFYYSGYPESEFHDIFASGRSFITQFDIGGLYSHLRELDFDFGLLPPAKYDEAQENYYSAAAAGIIGIPSNIEDPERTGMIAEALGFYSYKYLRPAFFDIVLSNKVLNDADSYNVLTIMQDNKMFDFAYNFDSTGKSYNALANVIIGNQSTDFASYYAAIKDGINASFRNMFDEVMNG